MTTAISIDRARPDESQYLGGLIAAAFHDLPQCERLVPDPVARRTVMPCYFELLVEQAMGGGAVYVSADRNSVAVWMYMIPGFTRLLPDYDDRMAALAGKHIDRFRAFDRMLDAHHPVEVAHHYLALLATTPARQNRGYGDALLRQYMALLDREHLPAYLEAATPQSVPLYQRHGFTPYSVPFAVLENEAPMYPMWRYPRPAAT